MNNRNIALIYDFDSTLTMEDSLSYDVFPSLNVDMNEFWQGADKLGSHHQIDPHGAGMLYLKKLAEQNNITLSRKWFAEQAHNIQFCPGLEDEWFSSLEKLSEKLNLNIHHYIISAGQTELIKACSIAPYFDAIYANEFFYDNDGHAQWPAHIVNSTNKLQFLFRIHKGLFNLGDYLELYQHMPKDSRPIPFKNIIFIGDGETDIPCMKVTKKRGGLSLAVYPNASHYDKAKYLKARGCVEEAFAADYRSHSPLSQYIKSRLHEISRA